MTSRGASWSCRPVELPVRNPGRWHSRRRSPPATPSSSSRPPRRCGGAWIVEQFRQRRCTARCAAVRRVRRTADRRPTAGDASRRCRPVVLTGSYETAHRCSSMAPRFAVVGRDQRQERNRHHAVGRSRPGDRRPPPLRVRPRRAECSAASLGIVVGDLTTTLVPCPVARSRPQHPCRPRDRAGDDDGPLIPAGRAAPAGPHHPRSGESWLVEPRPIDADPTGRLWTPGCAST